MTTLVIMPGGFHPFHPGHLSLYQAARRVFPDAEVYVAATDDTSTRPFPFAVKSKLAALAGVEPGHFVRVKSPFRAEEITSRFDPQRDTLIFVRSEKDAASQPRPGGVKKDGSPSYLQPLLGAKKLEPFARHAYMAYLPTETFGGDMTSATQIRAQWPQLDDTAKARLINTLYPRTRNNAKLTAQAVSLLDGALSEEVLSPLSEQAEPIIDLTPNYPNYTKLLGKFVGVRGRNLQFKIIQADLRPGVSHTAKIARILANNGLLEIPPKFVKNRSIVGENQGWAATYTSEEQRTGDGQQGAGMTAGYQRRENQPIDETLSDKNVQALALAKQRIEQERAKELAAWEADVRKRIEPPKATVPAAAPATKPKETLPQLQAKLNNLNQALAKIERMDKIVQRLERAGRLTASLQNYANIDHLIADAPTDNYQTLNRHLDQALDILGDRLSTYMAAWRKTTEGQLTEKWSEKYKRSINCANPRGFSQKAHCAGRKK